MPPKHPSAYVRMAQPSELPTLTNVLTRAFAKDPAMNWYGCVTILVKDIDHPTPAEAKSMRNLGWFQAAICKATLLEGGTITVVAIPDEDKNVSSKPSRSTHTHLNAADNASGEEIIAVSLWLPPGKTLDMGPLTLLRCGILNVIRGWGFTGVKVGIHILSIYAFSNLFLSFVREFCWTSHLQ